MLVEPGPFDSAQGTREPIEEWVARGVAAGVIQAHAALKSPRLRVLREGGIPLAVEDSANAIGPNAVIVFEAEDGPSALVFAAGCPGQAALSLFKMDSPGCDSWAVLT